MNGRAASGAPPIAKRRFSISHQSRREVQFKGYSAALLNGRDATKSIPNANITPARLSPRDGRVKFSQGSAAKNRKVAAIPSKSVFAGRCAKRSPRTTANETDTSDTAALMMDQTVTYGVSREA